LATTNLAELASSHRGWVSGDRRVTLLAAILAASVLSTAIHYTHNYMEVRHYPQSSILPIGDDGSRLLIAAGWPALTAVGALGFWLYRRGTFPVAWACLAAYSFTGISSLIHFIDGNPHISPIWYATIFTDAFAGFAILGFVYAGAVYGRARLGVRRNRS
jgi:hypothetical protein